MSGASTYYRRSLFEKIGYFDEKYRLLEDYPFYVKALTLGVKINFLDIKSIRYGMDGVSTSTNINPLLKKDYEIFNQHLYSLPYLSAIERRTVFFKKVMSRKERYRNAIFYPEQLLLMLFKI
ncbi:hypothetical protein [Vibrio owensii]|uniref:hypothetical protein n=1 Tax=Vibrio owensii TaxID=696485 RepID=UPI0013CED3A5|nr:hypothetical protein [Vibrio owensii]